MFKCVWCASRYCLAFTISEWKTDVFRLFPAWTFIAMKITGDESLLTIFAQRTGRKWQNHIFVLKGIWEGVMRIIHVHRGPWRVHFPNPKLNQLNRLNPSVQEHNSHRLSGCPTQILIPFPFSHVFFFADESRSQCVKSHFPNPKKGKSQFPFTPSGPWV